MESIFLGIIYQVFCYYLKYNDKFTHVSRVCAHDNARLCALVFFCLRSKYVSATPYIKQATTYSGKLISHKRDTKGVIAAVPLKWCFVIISFFVFVLMVFFFSAIPEIKCAAASERAHHRAADTARKRGIQQPKLCHWTKYACVLCACLSMLYECMCLYVRKYLSSNT